MVRFWSGALPTGAVMILFLTNGWVAGLLVAGHSAMCIIGLVREHSLSFNAIIKATNNR